MYDISFIEPSLLPRERLVSEGVDKLESSKNYYPFSYGQAIAKSVYERLHKVF